MSQRHALGLLFLVLALGFAAIAYASGRAGVWVIAAAAAALGGWMLTMSLRLLRRR
jgi:predicted Na+-dependent transporter